MQRVSHRRLQVKRAAHVPIVVIPAMQADEMLFPVQSLAIIRAGQVVAENDQRVVVSIAPRLNHTGGHKGGDGRIRHQFGANGLLNRTCAVTGHNVASRFLFPERLSRA